MAHTSLINVDKNPTVAKPYGEISKALNEFHDKSLGADVLLSKQRDKKVRSILQYNTGIGSR